MQTKSETGRLAYIDATRGLAIILVVYCHVASISLGIPEEIGSFNDVVSLLHLPLFFFLSGFLMFKKERIQSPAPIWPYIARKARELLLPALIFVTIFALWKGRSFNSIILSQFKGGYWFTFFLFLFILLYTLLSYPIRKWNEKKLTTALLLISCVVGLAPTAIDLLRPEWPEKTFFQVISYQQFKHFLFFSFGAWIRARYAQLTQLSKEGFWKLLLVATPFLMQLIHHFHIPRVDFMTEWVFSLSGITLILLLFKGLSTSFENNKVGRCLSFIGRRSLDIYLLHFFILPSLHPLGRFFTETGNQVLEICLVTGIAIMIIAVCLLISHILRQSDILAKLLFGKADKIGG